MTTLDDLESAKYEPPDPRLPTFPADPAVGQVEALSWDRTVTMNPERLVAALTAWGWVEEGRRTGAYVRLRFGTLSPSLLVPLDPNAPEFEQLFTAALTTLDRLADLGDAAGGALRLATCSCDGKRWVDDEGWQPDREELARGRDPGAGLIPCGGCNEGGWNTPVGGQETRS